MPNWLQIILGVAAALTALGVIWQKGLKPLARLINAVEVMTPVLSELTEAFKDSPHAFKVLDQIQAQFRTDSGSSLRDLVNRLEEAAGVNAAAVETLKVSVEASRQMAQQDRERFQQVVLQLDRLTVKVDDTAARNAQVAADLAAAKTKADETIGPAGAAADAASRTDAPPPDEGGGG